MPSALPSSVVNYTFGTQILANHPRLTPYIAQTIGVASIIEHMWTRILIALVRSDARTVMAINSAVRSTGTQREIFRAVARLRMPDDLLPLYRAVEKAIEMAAKTRNSFCHHVWGQTPQIADALLLIDPVGLGEGQVGFWEAVAGKPGSTDSVDRTKVALYREADLVDAFSEQKDALEIVSRFSMLFMIAERNEDWQKAYNHLVGMPAMAKELAVKARKGKNRSRRV